MSFIALNISVVVGLVVLCGALVEAKIWPVVGTKLGKVKGRTQRYESKKYESYLGVPFAQPPTEDLRWEKPVGVKAWSPKTIDASSFSSHCTQFIAKFYNFVGMGTKTSEDCLYLNVFVPGRVRDIGESKLPVIFYVFGGGYVLGTGAMYQGHIMALHGKVIVVTYNYRTGTLGFLSTGDSSLRGNYGLWDSKLALEWVKEHISSFGGDPEQITVMGQSAGAAITSHLMVSNHTNQLFKNAICISGTSSGYFGVVTQPLVLAMLVSNIFNCSVSNTQDIEDCLRTIDAESLDFYGALAQKKLLHCNPTLLPNIDGDFLFKPAREAFQSEAGKHINLMTGSVQHDAAAFILKNPLGMKKIFKNNSATSHESLWSHMRQYYGFLKNKDQVIQRFMDYYPDMKHDDISTRTQAATQAMTEAWFGAASNWEASVHQSYKQAATYQYLYKYRNSFLHGYPEWLDSSHMDDLYSIFGDTFLEKFRMTILLRVYKKQDRKVSDNFMTLLTNFAHTSNPNKGPNKPQSRWNEYDVSKKNYLEINKKTSEKNFFTKNISKNYEFQMDTFNHYVYPPLPSFEQLKTNSRISEKELEALIEDFKEDMLTTYQTSSGVDELVRHFRESRFNHLKAK